MARLRAHQILRAHEAEMNGGGGSSSLHGTGGPISLGEFMDRWAASMPGVDTPPQDLLKVLPPIGSALSAQQKHPFFLLAARKKMQNYMGTPNPSPRV